MGHLPHCTSYAVHARTAPPTATDGVTVPFVLYLSFKIYTYTLLKTLQVFALFPDLYSLI
jgi:hypothetical protein